MEEMNLVDFPVRRRGGKQCLSQAQEIPLSQSVSGQSMC